jgi:hypothetical protein
MTGDIRSATPALPWITRVRVYCVRCERFLGTESRPGGEDDSALSCEPCEYCDGVANT